MELVILVIHIILAVAIIGVILLQPPESSSLGGLGSSNPMAGVAGRGQGNILTRATAILAGLFIITSLVLAIIAGHKPQHASILDQAVVNEAVEGATQDEAKKEEAKDAASETTPAVPPSVPVSK